MLELMMVVASSPFQGLINTITQIVLPILLFVIGALAIRDAITGNITRLLTLVGVFILALVIFLNPGIIEGLAGNLGTQVEESIDG